MGVPHRVTVHNCLCLAEKAFAQYQVVQPFHLVWHPLPVTIMQDPFFCQDWLIVGVVRVMNVHDISVHLPALDYTLAPPPAHPTLRAKGYLHFLNCFPPKGELLIAMINLA